MAQYTIAIIFSAVVAGTIWLAKGDPWAAITVASLVTIGLLSLYRPFYSFCVMLFLILTLEQFPISRPFDDTLSVLLGYCYLGNLYKVVPLEFLKMNAFELHLGFLVLALVVRYCFAAVGRFHLSALLPQALLFMGVLGLAEMKGLAFGGEFLTSLWEIRALVYLVVILVIAPVIIQTEREVKGLIWVICGALALKAAQGAFYFAVTLSGRLSTVESILAHEDSHFFAFAMILWLGLLIFRQRNGLFLFLSMSLPIIAFVFLINQRRVNYGTLGLGILLVLLLIDNPLLKRRALGLALAGALLAVPYFILFWNSESGIAMPVQQVRSIFDDKNSSNLYRTNEKVNLVYSITSSPFGEGFGRRYKIIVPLDDISKLFALWDFIPHNSILGFWTKAGTHGFIIFLLFFGGMLAEAANCYRRFSDPFHKVLALTVITQIVGQLIVSYYDLQLNYYRNMVFLGAQLGMLATLKRLAVTAAQPAAAPEMAAVRPKRLFTPALIEEQQYV